MTILVPFLKKIHKNYLTSSRDVPFKEWYGSQRKKLLPDAMDLENEKALLENIPTEDISDFEAQMKLVFQRNYGKLRRSVKGIVIRRGIFSRFMPKLAAVVLGLLVIAAGLQIFLTLTGITISVSSAGNNLLLSLPSAINKHFFSIPTPASQKPVAATTPAAPKTDSTKTLNNLAPGSGEPSLPKDKISETPRQVERTAPVVAGNRDSISWSPPVKKTFSSRYRASTASSSGSSISPISAAKAFPLSDTEAIKSDQPGTLQPQNQTNQALPEKSSSPSFKKKQPAPLPESSVIAP
jgi:hypothetical protein